MRTLRILCVPAVPPRSGFAPLSKRLFEFQYVKNLTNLSLSNLQPPNLCFPAVPASRDLNTFERKVLDISSAAVCIQLGFAGRRPSASAVGSQLE